MADANVPVLQSVRAAFSFLRFSVPRTVGVLAAVMLANLVAASAGDALTRFAIGLVALVIGIMANAALLRLAFVDEHPDDPGFRLGPMGFQWGRPETRLLGATLLLFLLLVIAILFVIIVAIILGVAQVAVSGASTTATASEPVQLMIAGLVLALGLVGIWVGVRVCLYPAATVAERRLVIFSTWTLTHGQFWRILAAMVLVLAPTLALTSVLASTSLPRPAEEALSLILSVVNAFVEIPLVCGLYAYLYRGLRPPEGLARMAASV